MAGTARGRSGAIAFFTSIVTGGTKIIYSISVFSWRTNTYTSVSCVLIKVSCVRACSYIYENISESSFSRLRRKRGCQISVVIARKKQLLIES